MSALDSLERNTLNRDRSPYLDECAARASELTERVRGKRILAIGAAGSIGSQTVKVLLRHKPAVVQVVDVNENGLAELVRDLRSSPEGMPEGVGEFRTLPLDFGSPIFRQFLRAERPFDFILNFAAIKHVRSEKDVFSVLHMIDTNILKQAQLLGWLDELAWRGRYFSVSTDKAANPSSFMGATKRLMEHVIFHQRGSAGSERSSARFANVAFSNGSLLESFEVRLRKGQLLACPREIRRYFVTLQESGAICALAALLVESGTIAIPDLNPEENLVPLKTVAEHFLASRGLEAVPFDNEADARAFLARQDRSSRTYPLLLTPPDTVGEKPYEEFVARGETSRDIGLVSLKGVRHLKPDFDLPALVEELRAACRGDQHNGALSKLDVKDIIARIEPEFAVTHIDTDMHLDQRV